MLAAGKWAIAIIPCGIALGALLGSAANPDMKDPPAQWWQLAGQQEFAVSDQVWIEAVADEAAAAQAAQPDAEVRKSELVVAGLY